jgi:hypothetical protein
MHNYHGSAVYRDIDTDGIPRAKSPFVSTDS